MLGLLIPLSILAFVAVLIALGVFVVIRVRSGESLVLSFRTILLAYFYLMSITSFLVLTVGLSMGVKAGLSDVLGREFSYYTKPAVRMVEAAIPVGPGEPRRAPELKAEPVPEEELARQLRRVEREYQEDLIRSGTMVVVGGLIWGLHVWGRRRLQGTEEAAQSFFSKAYATILLAIFGIVGVVSLTTGAYEMLRYLIIEPDEFGSRQQPGGSVSTALIFAPVWFYFLISVMRRGRQEALPTDTGTQQTP